MKKVIISKKWLLKFSPLFFSFPPVLFSFVLFLFSLICSAQTQPDYNKIMSDRNNQVLYGRVYFMLKLRFKTISKCSFSDIPNLKQEFDHYPAGSSSKEALLELLSTYYQSYQTAGLCKMELDSNEMSFHEIEQKKFKLYYVLADQVCSAEDPVTNHYEVNKCKRTLNKLLVELNPHCSSTQVSSEAKYLDKFECTVGDLMIGRLLYNAFKTPEEFISESKYFFKRFWESAFIFEKLTAAKIDLYSLYVGEKEDTLKLRKVFLASLTMFHTSSPSMSPYVKGFQDYFWRHALLENGNAERSIFLFNESRKLVDEFRNLKKVVDKKRDLFTIEEHFIKSMNRHNYMSMFLSCYYSDSEYKFLKNKLPVLLGTTYESMDFISHLTQDGDTFAQAKENFLTDTNRYKLGVEIANSFCKESN